MQPLNLSSITFVDTLVTEVQSFPDKVKNTRFFIRKNGVEQEGKILSSFFCGFYTKEKDRAQVLFVNHTSLVTNWKKIKFGFLGLFEKTAVVSISNIALKVFKSENVHSINYLLKSFEVQAALYRENSCGIAVFPRYLHLRTKDRIRIVDNKEEKYTEYTLYYYEERYSSHLSPRLFSSNDVLNELQMRKFDAVNGFKDVALALNRCHQIGQAHRDVKGPNILMKSNSKPHFYLFDFDLLLNLNDFAPINATEVDYDEKIILKNKPYFAWDMVQNQNGYVTPFCDLYGWTITMGTLFWGNVFLNLAEDRLSLWNGKFESWMAAEFRVDEKKILDPAVKGSPNVNFHLKVFRFVRRIIQVDFERGKLFKGNGEKLGKVEGDILLQPYKLDMDEAIKLCDELLALPNVAI